MSNTDYIFWLIMLDYYIKLCQNPTIVTDTIQHTEYPTRYYTEGYNPYDQLPNQKGRII